MQVSQIMTPDPDTAQLQDTLQAVAAKMDNGDYGSMPVIDGGRLVGVVALADVALEDDEELSGQTLEEISQA